MMNSTRRWILLISIITQSSVILPLRNYTKNDILRLREEAREMFQHGYDSYMKYAYPYDELRPLTCDGVDTWGSYSLTLIDAMDTLVIMGNYTEFNRVAEIVAQRKDFDADINVSVFETNIRIVGGLLSAHLLSHKTGLKLEPGWPCNGPLLRLAEDVAKRLLPAFDTPTGMPYGTINLRSGVPPGETSVTCAAGVGTFIVEFGTLSRLTGDPIYEEVAYNALLALHNHRSPIGLLGNHIDVVSGKWTAQDAGIGGGVDSYYEYLVKGALLLERPELMSMFKEAREAVDKYLLKEDWYIWASMVHGQPTLPVFQSLDAYWPALLSLIGENDAALRTLHNYWSVWRRFGFVPEWYRVSGGEATRPAYPLRPELAEAAAAAARRSADPAPLALAEDMLRSIRHSARTRCGYATIKDVRDHSTENRMESFFLAETVKYLYLVFDPDNFIYNPGSHGKIIDTLNGECLVDLGGYIFNTEAHPIDPALLHCCHEGKQGINISEVHRMYQILEEEDNIHFMTMIDESANSTNNQTNSSLAIDRANEAKSELNPSNESNTQPVDQNQVLIKTETRVNYVNIDGTEVNDSENDSKLKEMLTETLADYYKNNSLNETQTDHSLNSTTETDTTEVDDIIIAPTPQDEFLPPSSKKARDTFRMLPSVLREFLSKDWKTTPKCEPQDLLERIRNQRKYPEHPHMRRYDLLLTPAPSFLERISLGGEFIDRKHLKTEN